MSGYEKASGVRYRARAELRTIAAAVIAAGVVAGASRARGETVYDLVPSLTVGWTDNPRLIEMPQSDYFGILATIARVRYTGARWTHAPSYRIAWTYYVQGNGIDDLTNSLADLSTARLSPSLELNLGASATLSRLSRVDLGTPAAGLPQAVAGGNSLYLNLGAMEELVYTPSALWRYTETVNVARVHYFEDGSPPNGFLINARGRGEYLTVRDTLFLELTALGTFSSTRTGMAQLLAGWRRDLSLTWWSQLQAGALLIVPDEGSAVVGPAGGGAVGYRRLTWHASLTVLRTPAPNLFLGQATITNQAVLQLTLPLLQNELLVITGSAGYTYAHPGSNQMERAYDQRMAAGALTARFGKLPVYGSLQYSYIDQDGNPASVLMFPSLTRHVLMLNVGATLTFGPGAPPLIGSQI